MTHGRQLVGQVANILGSMEVMEAETQDLFLGERRLTCGGPGPDLTHGPLFRTAHQYVRSRPRGGPCCPRGFRANQGCHDAA
jgi:hypothetical protein